MTDSEFFKGGVMANGNPYYVQPGQDYGPKLMGLASMIEKQKAGGQPQQPVQTTGQQQASSAGQMNNQQTQASGQQGNAFWKEVLNTIMGE